MRVPDAHDSERMQRANTIHTRIRNYVHYMRAVGMGDCVALMLMNDPTIDVDDEDDSQSGRKLARLCDHKSELDLELSKLTFATVSQRLSTR